jgi:hypothetical protein
MWKFETWVTRWAEMRYKDGFFNYLRCSPLCFLPFQGKWRRGRSQVKNNSKFKAELWLWHGSGYKSSCVSNSKVFFGIIINTYFVLLYFFIIFPPIRQVSLLGTKQFMKADFLTYRWKITFKMINYHSTCNFLILIRTEGVFVFLRNWNQWCQRYRNDKSDCLKNGSFTWWKDEEMTLTSSLCRVIHHPLSRCWLSTLLA